MVLFRWIFGLPIAGLVTVALFFMMAQLIKDRYEPYPDPKPSPKIRITAEKPVDGNKKNPPKPKDLPDSEPPLDLDLSPKRSRPDGTKYRPEPKQIEKTPPSDTGIFSAATIRTTPLYPEGCRSRGASGVVIVQFDVTPEGNVTNAQVIESPDRCFNRPVLKSVAGWKFPPSKSGAGMRYGYVETFNFQLVE